MRRNDFSRSDQREECGHEHHAGNLYRAGRRNQATQDIEHPQQGPSVCSFIALRGSVVGKLISSLAPDEERESGLGTKMAREAAPAHANKLSPTVKSAAFASCQYGVAESHQAGVARHGQSKARIIRAGDLVDDECGEMAAAAILGIRLSLPRQRLDRCCQQGRRDNDLAA